MVITAFKEPRSKNAGGTLIMMAVILGSMMLVSHSLHTRLEHFPLKKKL